MPDDINGLRVRERLGIPLCRTDDDRDHLPLPDGPAAHLDVGRGRQRIRRLGGRIVLQSFLHRRSDPFGMIPQSRELSGMPQQGQQRVGKQGDPRTVTGGEHGDEQADEIIVIEPFGMGRSRLDHGRHQIVLGISTAAFDQLAEVGGDVFRRPVRRRGGRLIAGDAASRHQGKDSLHDPGPVLLRHSEPQRRDFGRIGTSKVIDDIHGIHVPGRKQLSR